MRILLTGCTGFVGKFTLRELLVRTEPDDLIICLLRGKKGKTAQERWKELQLDSLFYGISFNKTQMIESDQLVKRSTSSLITALSSQIPLIQASMEKDIKKDPSSAEKVTADASAAIQSIQERIEIIGKPLPNQDEYIASLRKKLEVV